MERAATRIVELCFKDDPTRLERAAITIAERLFSAI